MSSTPSMAPERAAPSASAAGHGRRPTGEDRPCRPPLRREVKAWAVALAGSALLLVLSVVGGRATAALDRGLHGALRAPSWAVSLADDVSDLAAPLGYRALWVPTALVLVWFARWRALLVHGGIAWSMATLSVLATGDASLARAVRRRFTGSPEALVLSAWPVLVLSAIAVATLYALTPSGRVRRIGWVVVGVVLAGQVAARVALGQGSATTSLLAGCVGASLAALAFTVLVPEEHFPVRYRREVAAHLQLDQERTDRICAAVHDQLGVKLSGIEPFRLDGSAGSTPTRLRVAGGDPEFLFGKLYSLTHLRSDRWYKVFRVLRYGRLEDEGPFASVRRLVEHEDYMLRLLRDCGIRVPKPWGVVEVVPHREYLLVTELVADTVELGDVPQPVPDALIDDALDQIRRLQAAGAAHRDVKPSNVLVQAGQRVVLIDVSFGELRPSWWRQAVDLADMLLMLGLLTTPERTLARARRVWSDDELSEAIAVAGAVTIPHQLRTCLEATGRDLVGEFRALLPPRRPVRIQRWSARRVGLALAAVGSTGLAVVLLWANLRAGGML